MMDKITDATCSVFGITRDELFSRDRRQHVADARCIAIELICLNGSYYYCEIVKLFNRDRTTINSSRYKFNNMYGVDGLFTSRYDRIVNLINQNYV